MNKEKNFVSAVVYVHNAEDRIGEFVNTIKDVFEESFEHSEIICVNDSSTDDSLVRIREVSKMATSTSISVINMSYFHGLEIAMNAGVDLSIGDFVFEFDNTYLDFEKAEIMNVYRRALQGNDIVTAVPKKKEKVSSKMFYYIFGKFTRATNIMHTESFRILSRRVINRVGAMNKTVPYRKVIYATQGLKMDTICYDVIQNNRMKGDKLEKNYRSYLATDALILFTDVGYVFSRTMTVVMMMVSVFILIYSVAVFFTSQPVAGWTTTNLFFAIAFFGLFGVLTIIIKYLQVLVNLVFKRKYYSFEGIEKLTK